MRSYPLIQCVPVTHGDIKSPHKRCSIYLYVAGKESILFIFRTVFAFEVKDEGQKDSLRVTGLCGLWVELWNIMADLLTHGFGQVI